MNDFAVELNDIHKAFKQKQVIKQISLHIPQGKIFGLLGPSGGGKTTLIKIIMGMLQADTGSVRVLGYASPHKQLLHKLGYMAQSDALYTDLSGLENLRLFAKLYGLSRAEQEQRVQYAASVVNLIEDLQLRVVHYSGGMKRRLSLAIALIQNPTLLILDEPTVGIDPVLKREIWRELLRLKNEEGKTIIVTTHAMDEAEKCDLLGMMRGGKLIAFGSPNELRKIYDADDFDEVFLKAGGEQV